MSKMTFSEAGKLGAIKSLPIILAKKAKTVENYNIDPKRCAFCNKALDYEKRYNKFCDHVCAAKQNNATRKRNGKYPRSFITCMNCGKATFNYRYCSGECHRQAAWQKRKGEIEVNGFVDHKWVARKYLKEVRGNKCEICGILDWTGQELTLIMDHINGNPYDWSMVNLRLICPNCDSLTATYKGRNKGNGRHSRRERYRKGLSH